MSTPMKIATYALALVVVFIAALELGFRVRPLAGASTGAAPAASSSPAGHGGAGHDAGHAEDSETAGPDQGEPEGLAATVDGYRLTLLTLLSTAGPTTEIRLL